MCRRPPSSPLGLHEEITLTFNRRVECADAERALSWSPEMLGELSCDEYSLTFVPSDTYVRDGEFNVRFKPPLQAKDGASLVDAIEVTYRTAGYLAVVEAFPRSDGGSVPVDSAITVVFDRPIVPLHLTTVRDDFPQPLRIEPAIAGSGEWINSAIYVFKPDEFLRSDTQFRVTVADSLTAVDGAVMESTYRWSFRTAAPAVVSVDPPLGTADLVLEPKIQVRFNQVMDRDAVERGFYVRSLPLSEGFRVSGSFDWADDGMGFAFIPETRLMLDTVYEAGFDVAEIPDLRFGNATGLPSWRYNTLPPPAIKSTDPVGGALDVTRGGFSLYFASPMDITTLDDKISIRPVPAIEPRVFYSDWSNSYTVSFDAQPSKTYTIDIAAGMKDIYGNAIDEPMSFSYGTAPRSPVLGMNVPGSVGFYNAYRAPTQLYIYHRGLDHVDLALYQVPLAEFVASLTGEAYYDPAHAFEPSDDNLLQRWRIDSDTPQNTTRYELLELKSADSATVEPCTGAPDSRLKVGDVAGVITEPDPLRARAVPPDGEILELLNWGYRLPVTGGPRCSGELWWWQVELRDGRSAWVAEGDSEAFYLEPLEYAVSENLTLVEDGGGLLPGVYFLELTSPGMERYYAQNRHFLNVSNAVITVKQATDRLTVWAVDVDTGAPISGERVSIYAEAGRLVGSGTTDEQGIALADIPFTRDLYTSLVVVLDGAKHFGIGHTNWSNGAEPWQFGYDFSYYPRATQTYLYTDRPVYRTGQPVYFRGIVRSKDDVVYMPPPFDSVPVTIRDARGEIVYQQDLELSDFGSFSGIFEIAPEASLGSYQVSAQLPSQDDYIEEGGGVGFLVAEYRLPEYQVTVSSEEPDIVQGDVATFSLEGRYFFGGAVSDAAAEYSVFSEPFAFEFKGNGNYDFGDSDFFAGPGNVTGVVKQGQLTTESSGIASFVLAGELGEEARSQRWRVEAAIRDEAGQTVYGSSSLVVHQGLFYLGARAENYVSVANEENRVRIIAVDWDSQPIANQVIGVQVLEHRWISVQEQDPETGRTAWTSDVEEIPVTGGEVVTGGEGRASYSFRPPNGGIFKVVVSARDGAGNLVRSATYSWVSSGTFVPWRQMNNRSIDLVPERTDYSVGERAKILIASPFQGTTEALISIERGDVLSVEQVTLKSNSQIYEFEIQPEHAPNIFVSVFLLKPVDEFNSIASWRIGMMQLLVDIEQKALSIDISADRETAAPQETVQYRLRVTDYLGEPVVAEVGIGLTDLAALSLAERTSPSLLESFFGPQVLSVRTSSSLIVNADDFTARLSEQKGGGGGFLEAGIVDLRGEFIDTPYWNPSVVTDTDGAAVIGIHLPDNLTTWRLDARAVTEGRAGDLLVGEETLDLLSTRPLLIRPVTPRFFIVGDVAQLAAVVNNNTGTAVSARVSLENVAGLSISDGSALVQRVTIPAGGRTRVTWLVEIGDVDSVAPIFVVRSDDDAYSDASISLVSGDFDGTLPVFRYQATETVGTAGVMREGGSRVEAVLLPRDYDVRAGDLEIRVDKSLAGVTNVSLTYLETETLRYWECTSTVVNRFLPNIVSYRALNQLGLARTELKSRLDDLVSEGLQELYARQLPDGGWSWCSDPRADEVTSAYALVGLAEAADQGYPIDGAVIRRAQGFLASRLIASSIEVEQWQLNRQAFLLYALARSGAPDVGRSTTLFESRERMSLDALAFLAQALHQINSGDQLRLEVLSQQMLNKAVTRATGIFFEERYQDRWNWSSDIRSTALVLDALLKIQPESELLPNIVRHLVSVREGRGNWSSRQENTWSIIALTNWMVASRELNPNYAFGIAVNDAKVWSDVALPDNVLKATELVIDVAQLIQRSTNLIEFERDAGDGTLYYSAHLNLELPVPEIAARSRGIEISRRYTRLDDKSEATIDGAAVGDVVQVRLRIVAPNTLRYVVIEDHFPAGAEAINPNLATSSQLGTLPGGERIDPDEAGWGWWFFDHVEFRDEKAVIYASTLPRGVYEYVYTIRPSIAGEYNVIPPFAQELNFPEVYGRGEGTRFVILE